MVSPTSYLPRTSESERVKLDTESDVNAKPGSCGCMASHAMLMMTKMETNANVTLHKKCMSRYLAVVVGGWSHLVWILEGGFFFFVSSMMKFWKVLLLMEVKLFL